MGKDDDMTSSTMVLLAPSAPQAELSGLVGVATRLIAALGEWGVGVLTVVETEVPPIPSEIVLPLAGFIARQGQMQLWLLLATSTLGSYLGALALYGLGWRLGHDRAVALLARLPLVDRRDFERSAAWFRRHGRRSVFGGRLVPGVRSLVSLPAGAERMPLLRFSVFTIAGSALWNSLLIGLGWVLGSRHDLVDTYSGWLNWLVGAGVVALIAWLVARRVRNGSPEAATSNVPAARSDEPRVGAEPPPRGAPGLTCRNGAPSSQGCAVVVQVWRASCTCATSAHSCDKDALSAVGRRSLQRSRRAGCLWGRAV